MLRRMLGAATLRVAVYEEVEGDKTATGQALLVVVLSALATGIGSAGASDSNRTLGLVLGVVLGLVGWALWAWVTHLVGTSVFKTKETQADWGQLARTLGFSQTPGLLNVLGVIEPISVFVILAVTGWQFVCMVVAVKQALDFKSTKRAIGVVLVGAIPYFLLKYVIAFLIGA